MTSPGRFTKDVIDELGRRAGFMCSNPGCRTLTVGPTDDVSGATNIGQAAHIFGLSARSARFKGDVLPRELGDTTNGIWLCANCHKQIDDDERIYGADLLFEWKRQHERAVALKVGKPDWLIQQNLLQQRIERFSDVSLFAREILEIKPPLWEYKLTAELLRTRLSQLARRYQRLQEGSYHHISEVCDGSDFRMWFQARFYDVQQLTKCVGSSLQALHESWGPPGVPGSEIEILEACGLFGDAGQSFLEWEEKLHFTFFPDELVPLKKMMIGVAGNQLAEMDRIQKELSQLFFGSETPSGTIELEMVFKLPDGFEEDFVPTLEHCYSEYLSSKL